MRLGLLFTARLLAAAACFLLLGCNRTPAPDRHAAETSAGANAFYQQLEVIKKSGEDSVTGPEVRALYAAASPAMHDAVLPAVLKVLGPILLFNTNADTGIVPFYRSLCNDERLSERNQAAAAIKLANYFAHIAQDADSALFYLQKAVSHPAALDDSLTAKSHSIYAQVYQLRGELKEAAGRLYQSIALNEKLGDSSALSGTYVNLANVYREMNDFSKAIELRKKGLAYFTSQGNIAGMANACGGLAADYQGLAELDSARSYYAAAERLFASGARSPVAEYYLYISKAGMYVTLKKFDSSVLYFDKAKKIVAQFNDPVQERLFRGCKINCVSCAK